jgi:hypothetical protein
LASVATNVSEKGEDAFRRWPNAVNSSTGYTANATSPLVLDELLRWGWVEPTEGGGARPEYRLTVTGETALRERGVDIAGAARSRRLFAFGCPDWTERHSLIYFD